MLETSVEKIVREGLQNFLWKNRFWRNNQPETFLNVFDDQKRDPQRLIRKTSEMNTKNFVFQGTEADLHWFIGFAEGDGCWQADLKKKQNSFIINKKDPKVLYKIRKILGFGIIKEYAPGTPTRYFRFSANTLEATEKLITIFNGNL